MSNDARQTIDITADFDSTGESVVLDLENDNVLGIYIRGDASANYDIDVSNTPASKDDWFEGAETLTGSADYNDGWFEGARYVRVKVQTGGGTGGSSDTADILVTSSGAKW